MDEATPLTPPAAADASQLLRAAMRLQEIEGNPLDADDVALFGMFEREGWTHERRRATILAQVQARAVE